MQNAEDNPIPLILPVKPEHLDAITELERICFPCPWKRSFFEQELSAPRRFLRVLYLGGMVIGYLFSYFIVPEIHISKIATHPDFQRKGYAHLLMEDLRRFCLKQGIDTVTLEVRTTNVPALNFYKTWNFEILHIRKRYYDDGSEIGRASCRERV